MKCWNPMHSPPPTATAYVYEPEDPVILLTVCPHCAAVADREGAKVRSFMSLKKKKAP